LEKRKKLNNQMVIQRLNLELRKLKKEEVAESARRVMQRQYLSLKKKLSSLME